MQESRAQTDSAIATAQRFTYAVGIGLVASGLIHLIIWSVEGAAWAGPVSWRKPILFGFSTGVTVLSIGWVLGLLKPRWGDSLLLAAFSLAMLVEVGLITLQTWRGVPSHFNDATPFDAAVLAGIDGLILSATVVIGYLTVRSFGPLSTDGGEAIAIRGGMALLLLSCLLGVVMVLYGRARLAAGNSPETFGAGGVMKFPHGVPMHAIQVLPMIVWTLRAIGVSPPARSQAAWAATAAAVLFTLFAIMQTFTGRGRIEFWWPSAIALIGSALLILVPAYLAISHWLFAKR